MLPSLRHHVPLLVTLLLLGAVGFAAMNNQNNLLFWVFGVIAAALLVSLILSHLSMRAVTFRRLDPKHGAVGEPLVIHYAITNRSRWLPVFNLVVEESPDRNGANWRSFMRPSRAWVMHLSPGETVHGEAVTWPRRRGSVTFGDIRCWTTFPFGMVRRSKRLAQPAHTLIFPRLYRLRRGALDSIMPAGPLGLKMSDKPGGGDDYFGLREYKPGDSRRQIAWKRSAGSQSLIIKERTLPSPPRLRVALDLTAPSDRLKQDGQDAISPRELEERAISLAATVIDAAHREGYEVGLAVLGFDLPPTPLRQSHWHVEKIMGALASIDLDLPRLDPSARRAPDGERAGVVVIHAGRIDPSIGRGEGWRFSALRLEHLVWDRPGGPPGGQHAAAKPAGDAAAAPTRARPTPSHRVERAA
jgi:uncharacterized protein (DUF58 family)